MPRPKPGNGIPHDPYRTPSLRVTPREAWVRWRVPVVLGAIFFAGYMTQYLLDWAFNPPVPETPPLGVYRFEGPRYISGPHDFPFSREKPIHVMGGVHVLITPRETILQCDTP